MFQIKNRPVSIKTTNKSEQVNELRNENKTNFKINHVYNFQLNTKYLFDS